MNYYFCKEKLYVGRYWGLKGTSIWGQIKWFFLSVPEMHYNSRSFHSKASVNQIYIVTGARINTYRINAKVVRYPSVS